MTPEQFLTNEGYFEASEFTFDSVAELMLRYAQSQHDGKPLVSSALPPDHVVEQWWAGDEVGSAHFWQKAPYRTNGDVIEDIKAALKHFMGGNDC